MSPRKKAEEKTVEDTDTPEDIEATPDDTPDEPLTTEEADQAQDELKEAVEVRGDGFPPETPAVSKLPNRNLDDLSDEELTEEERTRKYHPEWYIAPDVKSSDPTAAAGRGVKSPVETVTYNDKD